MSFVVDLYIGPHMELREQLFAAANAVGRCEFFEDEKWRAARGMLNDALDTLKTHSRCEDTYLHPILEPKLPAERHHLEAEHEGQELAIAHLHTLMTVLDRKEPSPERQQRAGIELYRALNRFIADYLMHLDDEEYLMHSIWHLFSQAEIFAVMIPFKCIEEPSDFSAFMTMVNSTLSNDEQTDALAIIKERLGDDIYCTVSSTIAKM